MFDIDWDARAGLLLNTSTDQPLRHTTLVVCQDGRSIPQQKKILIPNMPCMVSVLVQWREYLHVPFAHLAVVPFKQT